MTPYEYIKKEIILSKLKPGEVFNEEEVAKKLNVSRTPIREAVLKLAHENYLTIIPRKGTIVSYISFDDINKIYELRIVLETSLIKETVNKIDKNKLNEWKTYYLSLLNEDFKDVINEENNLLKDEDKEFHLFLYSSLNNKYIDKEISYLMDQSLRIRFISNLNNDVRYKESIKEHINIIDLLLNDDADAVALAMKNHLENTLKGYKL